MHKQLGENLVFFRWLMAAFQGINCLSEKAYWSQHLRKQSTTISREKKKGKGLSETNSWKILAAYLQI